MVSPTCLREHVRSHTHYIGPLCTPRPAPRPVRPPSSQEWPAHAAGEALDEATAAQADAVLFVVDAASAASVAYFRTWVHAVPDGVPTVVVATLHEGRGKEANAAGLQLLAKLCSETEGVSLAAEVGQLHADPAAAEPMPAAACGLSLQVFRFALRVSEGGQV